MSNKERLTREFIVDEEFLPKLVDWPEKKFTPSEVREIFDRTNRFIDFDQTIAWGSGLFPKDKLCGKPTAEFLTEEPYVVQTWNPGGAVEFFTEIYPEYPKPLMIIIMPAFELEVRIDGGSFGKNFAALSLTGKTIIDDLHPKKIHAPNCTILHPDH